MRVRHIIIASVVVPALAVGIAGCTHTAKTTGPGATSTSAAGTGPIIDNGLVDLRNQANAALQKVALKCMDGRGFTVHPTQKPLPNIPPQIGSTFMPRITSADAASKGYGLGADLRNPPADTHPPKANDAFSRLPASQQDAYNAAWGQARRFTLPDGTVVGMPMGGCDEQATKQLFGDVNNYLRLQTVIGNDENAAISQAETDQRVKNATRSWASCMAQAGYSGLDETSAAMDKAMRYYAARGSVPVYSATGQANEIKLAKADATCASSTKVDQITWQVQSSDLSAYRKQHDADFVAYRQLLTQALTKAQQALGS